MPTSVFYISGSLSSLCSVVAEQYFVYLKEKKNGVCLSNLSSSAGPDPSVGLLLFYYCRYCLFVPRADGLSLLKRYRFPRGQFKISLDGRWLLAPSLGRDSDAGRRPLNWKPFGWIVPLLIDRSSFWPSPVLLHNIRFGFSFIFYSKSFSFWIIIVKVSSSIFPVQSCGIVFTTIMAFCLSCLPVFLPIFVSFFHRFSNILIDFIEQVIQCLTRDVVCVCVSFCIACLFKNDNNRRGKYVLP